MKQLGLCEGCRDAIVKLLDERMVRILAVAREQAGSEEEFQEDVTSRAECFHLMEIQRIVQGQPTCGVYDDYGRPPEPLTIRGPLFPRTT